MPLKRRRFIATTAATVGATAPPSATFTGRGATAVSQLMPPQRGSYDTAVAARGPAQRRAMYEVA